jgi:hypothetical protein
MHKKFINNREKLTTSHQIPQILNRKMKSQPSITSLLNVYIAVAFINNQAHMLIKNFKEIPQF